jgi:hypothetical protein
MVSISINEFAKIYITNNKAENLDEIKRKLKEERIRSGVYHLWVPYMGDC